MRPSIRGCVLSFHAFAALLVAAQAARGEILEITGVAEGRVIQFVGAIPVQTDFGQEIVPLTKATPPAVARARLDRHINTADISAAGQVVAVLDAPSFGAFETVNDVGLEVGAFSDDTVTGWFADGTVKEKRILTLSAADVGNRIGLGNTGQARSRLLLSGAMVLTAENPSGDLTGTEVSFAFNLIRRQSGRLETTPLAGSVALVGGTTGSVSVANRTGALDAITLPIVDFSDSIPEFPLVRAILFTGVSLEFEYDFTVGQPFELELSATAQVKTAPGGIGATAVFGLPQDGFAAVLERVKKDDRGARLAAVIAQSVDTTGAAYVGGGLFSLTGLLPMCGATGMGMSWMLLVGGSVAAWRVQRSRKPPRFGW